MFLTDQTSVLLGALWGLVCVGIGTAPELVAIARGLRMRLFGSRSARPVGGPTEETRA